MIQPVSRPPLASPADDVDVAVVGAGAAGIAGARACLAAGLGVAVLEARDRVGGRAVTARVGGHPVDLGAHWLHAGALNPLVPLGRARGEPLYRSPQAGHLVVNGRLAGAAERRGQNEAFERVDRALATAARLPEDRPISAALPPLGRWGAPTARTFALLSGRPLSEVSTKDFPSDEFGDNHFVRGGYGAYLARLAAGLPVALGTPVSRIDWSRDGVRLETPRGTVRARAALVTVPLPVIRSGALRFAPDLPEETARAIDGFLPGAYEHVLLNWPRSPFPGHDRLVKIVGRRTSYGLMVNMEGAPFHYLELDWATVAGQGRDAARAGGALARTFLRDTFGGEARRARVLAVTDWLRDPWSLCGWVVAPPGHAGGRAALGRAVGERVWFAGEANSSDLWGTVGGAWAEAERAVGEIAARLRPRGRATR